MCELQCDRALKITYQVHRYHLNSGHKLGCANAGLPLFLLRSRAPSPLQSHHKIVSETLSSLINAYMARKHRLDYDVTLPKDVCLAPVCSCCTCDFSIGYCNVPTLQMQNHHCAAISL